MEENNNNISKEELEKKVMDVLIALYSDQMGCEYTYRKKENKRTA